MFSNLTKENRLNLQSQFLVAASMVKQHTTVVTAEFSLLFLRAGGKIRESAFII